MLASHNAMHYFTSTNWCCILSVETWLAYQHTLSPFLPPSPSPPTPPSPSPGELDDIPEVAFYMVGPIEDVVKNAEQLAAQQ